MKESIEVRNLGPLKDVYLPEIKPLTVLIGESASGKSVLMKTVILMRYIYKMLNIRWYLKNSGINKSPFRLKFEKLIHDDLAQYFGDKNNVYIKYSVKIHGNTYSIEYSNRKLNTSVAENIPYTDLFLMKESWVSESRNTIPAWTAKAAVNKKAELGFYFHETLSDFDKATEAVKSFDIDYVGMKMKVSGKDGKKKFFVKPVDESYSELELKYASSGIQTSAPISALVTYFAKHFSFKESARKSVLDYLYEADRLSSYRPEMEIMDMSKKVHIHIEEPELSLFPDAQCKLIESIAKTAFIDNLSDRSVDIMMATHSPYIINYLNVILHQNKSDKARVTSDQIAIYRIFNGSLQNLLSRTNSGNYIINTEDLTEQMRRILAEYSLLKNNQQ